MSYTGELRFVIVARRTTTYDVFDVSMQSPLVLEILGFAGTSDGAVQLTPVGQHYATASTHERRLIFADRLMQLPSVKLIQTMVASHPGYQVQVQRLLLN